MSNLTVGLAVIGGLVLAGVIAHGAWTARRSAPRTASADEPGDPPATGPGQGGEAARIEPGLNDAPLPVASPASRPALDSLIDAIAAIAIDAPVSGDAALAALPTTRRAGSKPFAIEGRHAQTLTWEPPAPGQRYDAFQAGVQLASRMGALNDIEFSEFVQKAQAFADAIGGNCDFPDMLDEVARARELDQFASAHDAQISFTLRAANAAWSPGYVQQHAARLGFVAGALPGRMVLPAAEPGLPPLLGLMFDTQAALADDPDQAALREVTLTLDVPQVPRQAQPFVRLREAAVALAARMEGIVIDHNNRRIGPEGMDVVGAELEALYDILDQRDLSAGSTLARRLFS